MDIKKIRQLLQMVTRYQLGEFEIREKDTYLRIKQTSTGNAEVNSLSAADEVAASNAVAIQQPTVAKPELAEDKIAEDSAKQKTVDSPMVGTFYCSPSPDKPPFVSEGDEVVTGRVLCIIEAMKMMNHIKAEEQLKIIKILVEDGQAVEYGQPLFVVE